MFSGPVIRIGKRFLFSSEKGSKGNALSFFAFLSIFGLSLGVTSLLIVTSVMNGFETELKRALTSFHGHVLVFSRGQNLAYSKEFIDTMKLSYRGDNRIKAITPYYFLEGMLAKDGLAAGGVIEGVDVATLSSVSAIESKLILGTMPKASSNGIVLGVELARRINAEVGQSIRMLVPNTTTGEPITQELQVCGIMKVGHFDYDSKYALIHLERLQTILNQPGQINAFKILTEDAGLSYLVANALNEKYSYPLRARDWSSLNHNLFYAIQLQKVVIAIVLAAIILVASFNIVSTVIVLVNQKQKQIGILRAMGFSPWQALGLFSGIAAFLAGNGIVLGVFIGGLLSVVMQKWSLIDLPADIYLMSRIPVQVRVTEWLLIALVTLILALLAAAYPSWAMSRELPVKNLRVD